MIAAKGNVENSIYQPFPIPIKFTSGLSQSSDSQQWDGVGSLAWVGGGESGLAYATERSGKIRKISIGFGNREAVGILPRPGSWFGR